MVKSEYSVAQLPTASAVRSALRNPTPSAPWKMLPSFQAGYTREGVGHCRHLEFGSLLQSRQVTPHACCTAQDAMGEPLTALRGECAISHPLLNFNPTMLTDTSQRCQGELGKQQQLRLVSARGYRNPGDQGAARQERGSRGRMFSPSSSN